MSGRFDRVLGMFLHLVLFLVAVFTVAVALTGCSGTPTDELLRVAQECEGPCDREWEAWNRAEEKGQARREFQNWLKQCKDRGAYMYCDNMRAEDCYKQLQSGRDGFCQCSCRREQVRW